MFWVFACEACGILASQPRIEPALPTLEVEVLIPRPPGKSLHYMLLQNMEYGSSC